MRGPVRALIPPPPPPRPSLSLLLSFSVFLSFVRSFSLGSLSLSFAHPKVCLFLTSSCLVALLLCPPFSSSSFGFLQQCPHSAFFSLHLPALTHQRSVPMRARSLIRRGYNEESSAIRYFRAAGVPRFEKRHVLRKRALRPIHNSSFFFFHYFHFYFNILPVR